jgi:hypothetical protein
MKPEFLIAKITDIGLLTVYYFIVGFFISAGIDKFLGEFNTEYYKNVSTLQIVLEISVHLFILGIIIYILRNLFERVPFPLEGYGGYKHILLKEIQGGIVLSFVLLLFQENLTAKINYLRHRLFNIN